jgi:hypothetical protein
MPVAWFICPYITEYNPPDIPLKAIRKPAFYELYAEIHQGGGNWAGAECLGNHLVVKVRASEETLSKINALTGVIRIPKTLLGESLADLTANQKTAVRNKLENLGYSTAEIRNDLGTDIGSKTLGDLLRFAAKRRLTPRVDDVSGLLVLDGAERKTKPIADVDKEVEDK